MAQKFPPPDRTVLNWMITRNVVGAYLEYLTNIYEVIRSKAFNHGHPVGCKAGEPIPEYIARIAKEIENFDIDPSADRRDLGYMRAESYISNRTKETLNMYYTTHLPGAYYDELLDEINAVYAYVFDDAKKTFRTNIINKGVVKIKP